MTSEVAVMNSIGVALAADSAVSLGLSSSKIYTSADKLFQLHQSAPVGVMIYGNANLAGVPWETIIKYYRMVSGGRSFDTVQEYADDFLAYLSSSTNLFTKERQQNGASDVAELWMYQLLGSIRSRLDERASLLPDGLGGRDISAVCEEIFAEQLQSVLKSALLHFSDARARESARKEVRKFLPGLREKVFETLPLSRKALAILRKLICEILLRRKFGVLQCGLVVAGFGAMEFFPALVSYEIEEFVAGKPRVALYEQQVIDEGNAASVVPFAQMEMVQAFMQGVHNDLFLHISESTSTFLAGIMDVVLDHVKSTNPVLGASLDVHLKGAQSVSLEKLFEDWRNRQKDHWAPVLGIVAALPKDELAAMAEALVNLTKFRRRVTSERETVGGPIDVAVITKGDGFVWIRRKHYFPAELNPRIMARYASGGTHGN